MLDLKELSNEQQRSVIRAQMDGNEFFDHVLALGEMRRNLDNVWSTKFTVRERRELEGFFCAHEATQEQERAQLEVPAADNAEAQKWSGVAQLQPWHRAWTCPTW